MPNPQLIHSKQVSVLDWKEWNIIWSFSVVDHPKRFNVLCVLRCFSVHHGCKDWFIEYTSLSAQTSLVILLWSFLSWFLFYAPFCVNFTDNIPCKTANSNILKPTYLLLISMLQLKSQGLQFFFILMFEQ